MKKAIIIFTLLSLLTIGFSIYKGYGYIESLNKLDEVTNEKSEIIDANVTSEQNNIELEQEYITKVQNILTNNKDCQLWENVEETLKKISE